MPAQQKRRDPVRFLPQQGIEHVSPVELADRDQVQRGDQQADPAGEGRRVQANVELGGSETICRWQIWCNSQSNNKGEPRAGWERGTSTGSSGVRNNPQTQKMSVGTNPARGPEMPMSNRAHGPRCAAP